jgi:tRNA dimethylallyltransferase
MPPESASPEDNPLHRAIYLTGPTASGKTAVGLLLARRLDAEIIALDSMTIYRGMDIGTAKPTMEERGGVPHHLIDVLAPWDKASVAEYRGWALAAAKDIAARGKQVLFVGGTALYLKALLRGLFEGPGADANTRARLEAEADAVGTEALHERLARLDAVTAARLHPRDRRRIVRALEVIALSGQTMSRLQAQHDRPAPATTMVFALQRPRPELYDRINRRVSAMFEAGLVEEVRRLQSAERPLSSVAAQAVGYREVIDLLAGDGSLSSTINLVQTRSRQFAKRQTTWFRGLVEVESWPIAPDESALHLADRLARAIETRRREQEIP